MAWHNAITDIEGEHKRQLYSKVKDPSHRPQAEAVYRAAKFEQGAQLLAESDRSASEDPSYRERLSKRKSLPVINTDTPDR